MIYPTETLYLLTSYALLIHIGTLICLYRMVVTDLATPIVAPPPMIMAVEGVAPQDTPPQSKLL